MNAEQIQEARKLCENAKYSSNTYLENILTSLLPAALDEIEAQRKENERLRNGIEKMWEVASTSGMGICYGVNCLGRQSCGSPECKQAFMEHYLGSEES